MVVAVRVRMVLEVVHVGFQQSLRFVGVAGETLLKLAEAAVDQRVHILGIAAEALLELAEAVVDKRMRLLSAAVERCSNSPRRLSMSECAFSALPFEALSRTRRGGCR